MADFSPFGFSWQYSQTVSANALSPIVEYPWNPVMYGYTGDLAVAYLTDGTGQLDEQYQGFVYPAPVPPLATVTGGGNTVTYPPIIGVIVGFKYKQAKSLQNPLNGIDTASFYNPELTKVEPGAPVSVLINTDPAAIYSIQSSQEDKTETGIPQTSLFFLASLKADSTYSMNVGTANPATWNFAYGNNDTGQSLMYLDSSSLLTPTEGGAEPRRLSPLQIVGVTQTGTNGWYRTNLSERQSNNIVNVRLKLNLIVSEDYSYNS